MVTQPRVTLVVRARDSVSTVTTPNPHKGRSLLGAILLVFVLPGLLVWYIEAPPLSVRIDLANGRNEVLARSYALCVDGWRPGDSICTYNPEPIPSD